MTLPTTSDLTERLGQALRDHGVPGAVAGVQLGADRVVAAAGIAHARTGLAVARDTLFQVGSVTKVYTASAIMALIDLGRLGLRDTVAELVGELRLAQPDTASRMTVAHLLSHSAGLEGDHFAGPRGHDAVAAFIAELDGWEQLHEPGQMSSYCNVGWVVLGRIIEKATGREFHDALRELVLAPAGLVDTMADPEELLLRPVAVGHVPGADGPVVTPVWRLDPGAAPAGTTLCATIDDLLTFGQLHRDGGTSQDGTVVLSPDAVAMMHRRHLPRHGVTGEAHAGYGWGVYTWDGVTVLAHDGATLGHFSTLVVVPEHDAVIGVLTNGVGGMPMHGQLVRDLAREVLGIDRPGLPQPHAADGTQRDLTPYLGTYRRAGIETEVRLADGQLVADVRAILAPGLPPMTLTVTLRPAGDRFVHGPIPPLGEGPVDFLLEDGTAAWMFSLGRASRRVA